MSRQTFILTILLSLIIISQGSFDDLFSLLNDDTQPKPNITCLCTQNEKCDSNTRTCRLIEPYHNCYQTWTKEPNDDTIILTAGYKNIYFFI
jgi:hypothetical protein